MRTVAVGPGGEVYALNMVDNLHGGDGSPAGCVFDSRGKYLRTIMPAPGGLPPERTEGFGCVKANGQGQIHEPIGGFEQVFDVHPPVYAQIDDIIPGPHPHPHVDRNRPNRRMGKDEPDRQRGRQPEHRHHRLEVVAVGPQPVQPDHRSFRP